MNILIADQFSQLGGAQRCLLDLVPALRENGWRIHAALPGPGPLAEALRAQDAAVEYIACGPYTAGRKSVRDVARFVRDSVLGARRIGHMAARCDAHLLYINGPRLLPAAAPAPRFPCPVVFHCHSLLFRRYAARLPGWSLRRLKATLIASSRFVAEPLRPYVPVARAHIVYNGVPDLAAGRGPRAGPWRIGVVGRITPEKGQAEFLRAARILHRETPECRFVVRGAALFPGPEDRRYPETLRALAQGLPVEFCDWTEEPGAVFSGLDLLVVPSAPIEATPRVILEAFAAGVPVVAFRSGGIAEILSDGVTGFIADPPTPEELARKIGDLISNAPDRLERAAAAARAAWQERFSLKRFRREMLALIEQTARAARGIATPRPPQ